MHIAHPVRLYPQQMNGQMGGLFDVLATIGKTAGSVLQTAIPAYVQIEQAKAASKAAAAQIAASQAGMIAQQQTLPGGYNVPVQMPPTSQSPSWLIPALLAGGGVLVFTMLRK